MIGISLCSLCGLTLFEAVNMIQLGAMPLRQFTALHLDTKVTAEEMAKLKAFVAPGAKVRRTATLSGNDTAAQVFERRDIRRTTAWERRIMTLGMRFLHFAVVPVVAVAMWQHDPPLMGHMATQDTSWLALMKNMETMHEAMAAVEPSGNDDTDFVNLMLPHHQAAIDMARTELLYGSDPQMRRLAQEIITDQESEIQLMQVWLNRQRVHTNDPSQLQGSCSRREK